MSDNLPGDASGSERVGGLFRRLHPVTRFLVGIAVLHLGATLFTVGAGLMNPELPATGGRLAEYARSIAYSLAFFGSAATVEFLFRIWSELKLARGAR
jgi:hypothetical protein